MQLVYLGITSAISLLSGVLFAWWTQSRQNRRERAVLAALHARALQTAF